MSRFAAFLAFWWGALPRGQVTVAARGCRWRKLASPQSGPPQQEEYMMKTGFLLTLAVAAAIAMVVALPLAASEKNEEPFVLTERMQLTSFNPATGDGTQAGTFVAAGAVNASGSAAATFRVTPGNGGCGVLTGPHTFTTSAGTITVFTKAAVCPFPPPTTPRSFARGHWRIVRSSGAYAGLHGEGSIFATADFLTGEITIARDGTVERDD